MAINERDEQQFGGDERFSMTGLKAEMTIDPNTAVRAMFRRDKNQALVRLGNLQVIGGPADMEVAAAAFAWGAERLTATAPAASPDAPPTAAVLCTQCAITHSRKEPCASVGVDRMRDEAYQLMAATYCLSRKQAHLIVDSAALWVAAQGVAGVVAARMLLHQFVIEDVANAVVDLLVELQMRGYVWTASTRIDTVSTEPEPAP